jgi:PAS domain S-box-containing protein
LADGAAAALVTEESMVGMDVQRLAAWTAAQEPWSDLPFIVLRSRGSINDDAAHELSFLRTSANITLVERPIGTGTLVSTVTAALRARRQYEVKDSLEAVAQSEHRHRTLAEALPQLVWTCLPDGRCDYVNRRWVEYIGVHDYERLGPDWLGMVIHPDDRARSLAGWAAAVAGEADYDLEHRIRSVDGASHWFKTRATPIRDTGGRVTKWFGTSTQISEIVEAREALARSRDELERLVAVRTKSLADANTRLTQEIAERIRAEQALLQAQKLESIGQLTSGVAHDFNNLLHAVLGNIEMARQRIKDDTVLRFLSAANRSAERGANLTRQLLAFSRKQFLAPKPVDLNHIVSSAGDMLFRTMGTTVRIETVLEAGLWSAMVDPTQIELVLLNLAINGRDAMPDGGRLTLRTTNIRSTDRPVGLPHGDYVLIAVSDTGTGMNEEVRAKAFEPFFTTKEVGKGSGLGLSMVHGVVTQSGGSVALDSKVGEGTTVLVYLPRAPAAAAADSPKEAVATSRDGGNATILVVDDDPDVREVAVNCLLSLGYRILEAENGDAALTMLERERDIDLLLVDVAMPGMNGIELVRRARAKEPRLRALFATGYAAAKPVELGEDALLKKPYRVDTLAQSVQAALRREQAPPTNVVALKSPGSAV